MRKILYNISFFVLIALSVASCKKSVIISDSELKEIFKEVFLLNAYVQNENTFNPITDSLDIYRPLLKSRGYSPEDFEYTMLSFAKRKSSKLSTVVGKAMEELEKEEADLRYKASMLDSIDVWSQRRFREVVVEDSSFRAHRIKDTSNLKFTMPVKEGEYHISYKYLIDSTDKNRSLKAIYNVKSRKGDITNNNSSWMTAKKRQAYVTKIDVKPDDSLLTIVFGNYSKKNMTKPGMTVDSLRIVYMPTVKYALDSVSKTVFAYKVPVDTAYIRRDTLARVYEYTQDSSALYIYPPWIFKEWPAKH